MLSVFDSPILYSTRTLRFDTSSLNYAVLDKTKLERNFRS